MGRIKAILLVLTTAIFTASLVMAADDYKAKLVGKEETPAVNTKAKGTADFKLGKDKREMTYKVTVKDLENVTAAHIHLGKKGKAGPPLVNLFTGPKKPGKFSGVLAEGTIVDKDLTGELEGKTLVDLVNLIKSGDAYVNVHTDANPNGEIRGQLK